MNRLQLSLALLLLANSYAYAQTKDTEKIRAVRQQQEKAWLDQFRELLSIPNIAADSASIRKNAAFIMGMMTERGIQQVQLLEAAARTTPPAIYGEVITPGAKQTVVFYAHYDGQPVNPAQWANGLQPFTPALYSGSIPQGGKPIPDPAAGQAFDPESRLYGRSASDDKAGVSAILFAWEAIRKAKLKVPMNIKFFFEGEEEAGSPHLSEILDKHKALLQSDGWIICDGPVHQSGRKLIAYGVRGDAHVDLTVYGPRRPLHSGHYGNWVPNPAMELAKLLAGMKDEKGRVTIAGFYDDVTPLTETEKKALAAVPAVEEQLKKELGFRQEEMPGSTLMEAINLPSLNINGINAANVGKMAANVIPVSATAVLDLRLVLGNDWQKQQQKIVSHIKAQGFTVIDHEPTEEERASGNKLVKVICGKDGYNAQRTRMDLPFAQQVAAAVQSTVPEPIVLLPTVGGSLPLFVFEQYLQAKTITVSIANHDNNQHAENEHIRLANLWNGIETLAAIMLSKPQAGK